MKTIKFILCLFICVSCTSQTSQNNTSSKKEEETNIEKNSINTVYVFENDTIKQTVELSLCNEKEIAFKLISQNKQRKQESKIEGIAKIKGGDIELDEDAEGNAYPVNEYIYEKDCWLAFRIDKDTKTKIRINEADCNLHNLYCPFASVDLLVKQ
ncbi:MAG: hypothetical protein FD155_3161 [Bacteroidetes bacterium]|nr:MAG: hypothetical protein FD155_3161 [Bacteroidota bacterium]